MRQRASYRLFTLCSPGGNCQRSSNAASGLPKLSFGYPPSQRASDAHAASLARARVDASVTNASCAIRRRTRVVGAFPDGQSALNLAAAGLRHIAGTAWSSKRYLNLLKDQQMRGAITA